jgi:hypothetical protein
LEKSIEPLNANLNPICHLLALLGAHHILHVSGVMVKEATVCIGMFCHMMMMMMINGKGSP